jgi:hypothetical protein
MNFLCTCENVAVGTYANQETLVLPRLSGRKRIAGIDRCIIPLITSLWRMGIETIESCCGHGHVDGYVAVDYESIDKMRQVGFELIEGFTDVFVLSMLRPRNTRKTRKLRR